MNQYVAFLRAVNVGGTGKMPMSDLRDICHTLGYTEVRTYIASGNVTLASSGTARAVKAELEDALHAYAGKPVGVAVRTAAQLKTILKNNPHDDMPPSRSVAVFLDRKPTTDTLTTMKGRKDEQVSLGRHEIYVYYPSGQADTKLRIPAAATGTARNMNTIRKMADLASKRSK